MLTKSKYNYEVTKGKENYYSIICFDDFANKVSAVEDISEDKNAVEAFCDMLNATGVEPCHFEEIYDDYFG